MKNLNWHGVAAVVLALGVAGALILLSVGELSHDGHITEAEATTISAVLGAGVGAIAAYLGTRRDDSAGQ